MRLSPLTPQYFSSSPGIESACRRLFWITALILLIILVLFWEPLRGAGLIETLVALTYSQAWLEVIIRSITFLGDEEFFLILLPIVYWSVNKPLGFWSSVVLISATLITSEIPKDITRLPRPDIEIVDTPPTYTFPSGHTSGAVGVWGYMAVRLKSVKFWVWALAAMILVGVSRMMLGVHFAGDVLGGFLAGMLYLAVFVRISRLLQDERWDQKIPFGWLLVIAAAVPLAMSFIPATYAPRLMGYIAGGGLGYALDWKYLKFLTGGSPFQHPARAMLGIAVLFVIVSELGSVIPSGHITVFLHYALAGIWVTYLAPALFVKLGLSKREED